MFSWSLICVLQLIASVDSQPIQRPYSVLPAEFYTTSAHVTIHVLTWAKMGLVLQGS